MANAFFLVYTHFFIIRWIWIKILERHMKIIKINSTIHAYECRYQLVFVRLRVEIEVIIHLNLTKNESEICEKPIEFNAMCRCCLSYRETWHNEAYHNTDVSLSDAPQIDNTRKVRLNSSTFLGVLSHQQICIIQLKFGKELWCFEWIFLFY